MDEIKTFDDFLEKNFSSEIVVYLNGKKIYSGLGKMFYGCKAFKDENLGVAFKHKAKEKLPITYKDNVCYVEYQDTYKLIAKNIYGGKSIFSKKKDPYDFETVKCNKTDICPLYKEGICAGRSRMSRMTNGCSNAIIFTTTAGYNTTKASNLYTTFKEEASKLPKLKDFDGYFFKVGNECFFHLPYTSIYINKDTHKIVDNGPYDRYYQDDNYKKLGNSFALDIEDCTKENLQFLLSLVPRAVFGGNIADYQSKVIPRFKIDLSKYAPELAKIVGIEKCNYVGQKAILKTLKPNIECWSYDRDGYKNIHYKWDGEQVTILNPEKIIKHLALYYDGLDFTIKEFTALPNDKCIVTIEDNDWVLPDTKIVRY